MQSTLPPTAAALRSRRARGFTVVEMLIVVAIIGILAALLFPVFARAREGGRARACLSNMKQLGQAFQQYVNDNGRRYPYAGSFFTWGSGASWVAGANGQAIADLGSSAPNGNQANLESGAVYSYVKNTQVYVCPSNPDGRKKRLSYSMNCAISGIHDVKIRQPSDIVLLIDEEKANDGYFFAVDDLPAGSTVGGVPTNSTDALTQIHNGGGNLLFCDGSSRPFLAKAFPVDGTPAGKKNKWRQTGSPRFHDPAFGQWGSNQRSNVAAGTPDSCNATKRDPGT